VVGGQGEEGPSTPLDSGESQSSNLLDSNDDQSSIELNEEHQSSGENGHSPEGDNKTSVCWGTLGTKLFGESELSSENLFDGKFFDLGDLPSLDTNVPGEGSNKGLNLFDYNSYDGNSSVEYSSTLDTAPKGQEVPLTCLTSSSAPSSSSIVVVDNGVYSRKCMYTAL
jgi:hypothetical protein